MRASLRSQCSAHCGSMVLLLAALYSYSETYHPEKLSKVKEALTSCHSPRTMEEETKDKVSSPTNRQPSNVEIQQAWVDAVFGVDFPDNLLYQQATSSSAQHPFPFTTVTIPKQRNTKLGLTVKQLALGVYAHKVEGEALYAGVKEGSILLKVNGQNMVAEPTRILLEYLWTYEGYLESSESMPPMVLEWYWQGETYSTTLWTRPWGIAWAPCGQFPLVHRVYNHAAQAGVPKGALLGLVPGPCSLRDQGPSELATIIRQVWESEDNRPLALTFVTPPHRSGLGKPLSPPQKASLDHGVQIKFHSFSDTLCHSWGPPGLEAPVWQTWAEHVAAGRWEAPKNRSQWKEKVADDSLLASSVGPPPTARPGSLLASWDLLESLVFCLRLDQAHYDEEAALSSIPESVLPSQELLRIMKRPSASRLANDYLLSLISVICTPPSSPEREEEKTEDSVPPAYASELTSLLLKLSRRDEGFCQRLYFLLRSYISTFETRKPAKGDGDTSQNLVALLNCLELLRFAEKELAGQQLPAPEAAMRRPTSEPRSSLSAESPEELKKRGVFGLFRKKKGSKASRTVSKETTDISTSRSGLSPRGSSLPMPQSPSVMYDNMSDFLTELDHICGTVERALQKSFRQKIADWAMQPWSATKDSALAEVTQTMRESLQKTNNTTGRMLLVNPVDSAELLSSVDCDECYILPSAHFPILLTFNVSERRCSDTPTGLEKLYRTTVEIVSLEGSKERRSTLVHAAVAGSIEASATSVLSPSGSHEWKSGGRLVFDSRSSWGAPQTVSLRVSLDGFDGQAPKEIGYAWVDLSKLWDDDDDLCTNTVTVRSEVLPLDFLDENSDALEQPSRSTDKVELVLRVTTESVGFDDPKTGNMFRKRMLLYKHDDDLRQEAFAVQFIRTCDDMLKASGLDMKLLTFQCIPVGTRRGFVEWVPGSVPMSEICQPFAGSILAEPLERMSSPAEETASPSMFSKAGLTKYESLRRLGGQQTESLKNLGGRSTRKEPRGSFANNPVQDYLRSVAYDADAPYMIRRDVMDTYVKSCAGYCVITYILGVGDRHLDNLLLHQSGSFFHCDYSFILGSDPKKHLPLRLTEDMVFGMGGRESDNFAKFLSLASAAFLALRRPECVRVMLSSVRLMEASFLPDISENQTTEEAILGIRERLRLDLTDDRAVAYMEDLVETTLSNKLWLAVDAIHTLGKKF